MEVDIPVIEAIAFKRILETAKYWRDERGFKKANQLVIASVFPSVDGSISARLDRLARKLSVLFSSGKPDLTELGLTAEAQAEWNAYVAGGNWTAQKITTFLSGGRYGPMNFNWIPQAVEKGLGRATAGAFNVLQASDLSLDKRVDQFQDTLHGIHK